MDALTQMMLDVLDNTVVRVLMVFAMCNEYS